MIWYAIIEVWNWNLEITNRKGSLKMKNEIDHRKYENQKWKINTQYALYQYVPIRTTYQIETDGKASRNKKNKAPPLAAPQRGARAARAPLWVSCFSYSYLLFHLSRSDTWYGYVRIDTVHIAYWYARIVYCVEVVLKMAIFRRGRSENGNFPSRSFRKW